MDHNRYCDVKWAHILGDTTRYWVILVRYRAILAILEDIWVISRSVKSNMYWARPIQVVPGQFFFSCVFLAVLDTLRYDIAQNGRFWMILLTLRVISHISGTGYVCVAASYGDAVEPGRGNVSWLLCLMLVMLGCMCGKPTHRLH